MSHITEKGYRRIWCKTRFRMEHVLVWEAANGRAVPPGHCVHHENEDKLDNRIENLHLVTHLDHKRMHSKNFRRGEGGEWEKFCPDCSTWTPPTAEFWYMQRGWPGSYCRPCWVRRVVLAKQKIRIAAGRPARPRKAR